VSGDEILDEVTVDLTLVSRPGSSSSAGVGGGAGKQVSALIGAFGW